MLLALKLLLTPIFIASVSLAGRRWGPAVSGLLMGLPLTSGPISFILALQYGPAFAARAAVGTLCGQASVCIFCLAYSRAAPKMRWPLSSAVGLGAFFLATATWDRLSLSLLPALAVLVLVLVVVPRLIPLPPMPATAVSRPRWDLPARMIAATLFVLLLTTFANALGPQLSGLISPFPIFASVLAAFTQQQQGPAAVARLLRGLVSGSWAFVCFFLAVGALLPALGIGGTYTLATAAALAAEGTALRLSRP